LETREALERAHEAHAAGRHGGSIDKYGVVAVAALAALLAIASICGRRAVKDLLLYQEQAVEASNLAESAEIKARVSEGVLITLRVLATDPDTARAAGVEAATLEQDISQRFRPEQERAATRAHEREQKADEAERAYESIEVAETMFQIAIVFVTIAVAVRARGLLLSSGVLGLIGLVLLLDGFLTFLPY
jgi:hypothetical protein